MHNNSNKDIEEKTMHAIFGRSNPKTRVTLMHKNVSNRMYVWLKYWCNQQCMATFINFLIEMV